MIDPVHVTDTEAVQVALDAAQSARMARTLTPADVAQAALKAEARLDVLPVTYRVGAEAVYACAGVSTVSYGGVPYVTAVSLTRRTAGRWVLTDVRRVSSNRDRDRLDVWLPAKAGADNMLRWFANAHNLRVPTDLTAVAGRR